MATPAPASAGKPATARAAPRPRRRKPGPVQEDFREYFKEKLKRFSTCPELADVTFLVGPGKAAFSTSKFILAAHSAHYREKFYSPYTIKPVTEELPTHEPVVFKIAFEFLHTGNLILSSEELGLLPKVIELADDLKIKTLISACYRIVENDICPENVIELMRVADKYNETQLKDKCLLYIGRFAEKLFANERFVDEIPKSLLKELLSKDDVGVSEFTLFTALYNWAQREISKAGEKMEVAEFLKEYIPFIRFGLIAPKDLYSKVLPTGLIEQSSFLDIALLAADKSYFAPIVGKKYNLTRRRRPMDKMGAIMQSILLSRITPIPGPTSPYQNTHDGGAAVCNGKLYAHYGNDSNGTRLHITSIEGDPGTPWPAARTITIPFPTHGSYPASDRERYVYVFEDSDSSHGNGFARVDTESDTIERLRDMPTAHCRYSSGCFQGNSFWKLGTGNVLQQYDIEAGTWSTKMTFHANAILMGDPTNDDRFWIMFNGGRLESYSISEGRTTPKTNRPGGFSLGANYSALLIPRADETSGGATQEGILICAFTSGDRWKVYDSTTNTWTVLNWPGIGEGGHVAYDSSRKRVFIQANNSQWQVINLDDS